MQPVLLGMIGGVKVAGKLGGADRQVSERKRQKQTLSEFIIVFLELRNFTGIQFP